MAYPQDPIDIAVELLIDAVWTDITTYVRRRGGDGVESARGQRRSGSIDPSEMTLMVDNRDGRFSPRNPDGAWYGLIGQNTQIRASVTHNATEYRRFWGEVAEWPVEWEPSDTDVWAMLRCADPLRRLNQRSRDTLSLLRRSIPDIVGAQLRAYWPMEDKRGADSLASAGPRARPMRKLGFPFLADDSDTFEASSALPKMANGEFVGHIPNDATGGTVTAFCLAYFPDPVTTGQSMFQLHCTGTLKRINVLYQTASGGSLGVHARDENDALVYDSGDITFAVDGEAMLVGIQVVESGADVDYKLQVAYLDGGILQFSDTITGEDFGRPWKATLNSGGGLENTVMGHFGVATDVVDWSSGSYTDMTLAFRGYAGETALGRVDRLLTEVGLSATIVNEASIESEAVGAQLPVSITTLLTDAMQADLGLLHGSRTALGLRAIERAAIYNRTVALTLDYAAGELSEAIFPVEDDQRIANDVRVQRQNGSSFAAAREEGARGVTAIGSYPSDDTVNVRDDGQLRGQVGWRLNVGTVDEPRYPDIVVDTQRPQIVGDSALHDDVLDIDVGMRINIVNPPAWLPPDDIDLLVIGIRERIANFGHRIAFTCVPYAPYVVAEYDVAAHRYGFLDTTVNEAVTTTETGVDVQTDRGPTVSTTAANFDIVVGGERMTVTSVGAATAGAQTLTVTRSVNGVVATHGVGDQVTLAEPRRWAL